MLSCVIQILDLYPPTRPTHMVTPSRRHSVMEPLDHTIQEKEAETRQQKERIMGLEISLKCLSVSE